MAAILDTEVHLLFSQGVVYGLYADIILGDMLVVFNTCNHYGFASCVLGKTSSHPRSQTFDFIDIIAEEEVIVK